MANRIYGFTNFIGEGTGALDKLPEAGADALVDKDIAIGNVSDVTYFFRFDATSAVAESVPFYIAPRTGTGMWVLQSIYGTSISSPTITTLTQKWNAATSLTIASGVITATQTLHLVDTEGSAASDDLVTINGGSAGQVLAIRAADGGRTIVIKQTGNLLTGGLDITLDDTDKYIMFIYDADLGKWVVFGGKIVTNHNDLSNIQGGTTAEYYHVHSSLYTVLNATTAQSIVANPTGSAAPASALTVAEQTLVGRITGGNIVGLTATQVRTLLNVEDGSKAASDTTYGASWDGVTDISPSKNAVYNKIELLAPKDDPTFTTNATSPKFTQSAAVNYFYASFSGTNVVGNNTLGTSVAITTNVTWTESSDTSGVFSNGTFTAPANGLYYIAFFISPNENNIITIADSGLLVDGTVSVAGSHVMPNHNFIYGGAGVTSTAIVYLTTSQYVRGYAGVLNDDATKTTEADGWMFGYRIL